MRTSAALGILGHVTEAQWGLVTTRQATAVGVAEVELHRLTHDRALERVAWGVYRVSAAPRPRLLELRAAWLQLAPHQPVDQRRLEDGVVSHVSAAMVYEVGLLEEGRHEFTVPLPRVRRTRRRDVMIYRAPLGDDEVTWVEELLVTRPRRLVADLLAARVDGGHVAQVVIDVLKRRLATRRELAAAVAPYGAVYGLPGASGPAFLDYLLGLVHGRGASGAM